MSIVIRADSSSQIGLGHLLRCRTLARELVRKGKRVTFVCRDLPFHQSNLLSSEGFEVHILPRPANDRPSELTDAGDTIEAIRNHAYECLVVDHYDLGRRWEMALRPYCHKMLVVDDLANRHHSCDVLLDQNFQAPDRYARLVDSHVQLLGPRYALLDRSYAMMKPRTRTDVTRVLLFFGGADTANLTTLAIEELSAPDLTEIRLDVVVGSANSNLQGIERLASQRGNTFLYPMQSSLAELMHTADLSIGAGGATNWERLYSGLPSVVVSVADNQVAVSEALAQAGLIEYVGSHQDLRAGGLADAVRRLLASPKRMRDVSEAGPLVVDGYGAPRVAEVISPTAKEAMRLRPALSSDAVLYFNWANEADVRRQSLNTEDITWSDHEKWFRERMESPDSELLVLETPEGLPIGQIRFDRVDESTYRLSYALDRLVRGRGIGKLLVQQGMMHMKSHGAHEIKAEVKSDNIPSVRIFQALNFIDGKNSNEVFCFRYSF